MDETKSCIESITRLTEKLARYLAEEGEQERAASWVKSLLLSQKEKLANPAGRRRGHMSWPPPGRSDQVPRIREIEDALRNLELSLGKTKTADDALALRIRGDQLAVDVAYGVQFLACLPSAERSCERRTKPPSEDEVCAKFDATARVLIGWINLRRDEESRTDVKA